MTDLDPKDQAAEPDSKPTCQLIRRYETPVYCGKPLELQSCEHWVCPDHTDEISRTLGTCGREECAIAEISRLQRRTKPAEEKPSFEAEFGTLETITETKAMQAAVKDAFERGYLSGKARVK